MPNPWILTQQPWRADTLEPPARWYCRLSDGGLQALAVQAREFLRGSRPLPELQAGDSLREVLRSELDPVMEVLERGRGFVILEGLDSLGLSDDEARAVYWLVGQLLGTPVVQNVQGTLLYDVRDTGQSVEYGARFSVTNADSTFHTDASFADGVADYVGLLCLRTARSGGINHLVDGRTLARELAEQDPRALAELTSPFHVDRRGGVRPGEGPTVLRPVIERNGEEVLYRYLRFWIEVGQEKAGAPLTPEQTAALDLLDATARRPELQAEFSLRPGEMLWINNRWLLHSRTAFEDHPEPERRRHLVRLWVERTQPG